MRIFVAGGTGVVGARLVPRLIARGHEIVALTRDASAARRLARAGATPVLGDVRHPDSLRRLVGRSRAEVVMHQLTDLSADDVDANARLRIEGTRHLVDASLDAGVGRIVAQSVAWIYGPGRAPATESDHLDPTARAFEGVSSLERQAREVEHCVVLRYGTLYGDGTWYGPDGTISDAARRGEWSPANTWTSFVHADDAAEAAAQAISWPAGTYNIVDDDPARPSDWVPRYCSALDAPVPPTPAEPPGGRPVSNAHAGRAGWRPMHPTWRTGLPSSVSSPRTAVTPVGPIG